MATQSPFHLLEQFAQSVASSFRPPAWMVDEVQHRIVLMLNHVLMQEKAATDRLMRQKGRVVLGQWGVFSMRFSITPAGLLDLAAPDAMPDLSLVLTETSAVSIAQAAMRGDKPPVRIEGDVQLAAEINWLVDHVRWDIYDDLSRLIGDAPTHAAGVAARRVVQALRQFTQAPRAAAGPPA